MSPQINTQESCVHRFLWIKEIQRQDINGLLQHQTYKHTRIDRVTFVVIGQNLAQVIIDAINNEVRGTLVECVRYVSIRVVNRIGSIADRDRFWV